MALTDESVHYERFVLLTAQIDVDGLHKTFVDLVLELYPDIALRLYSNKLPANYGRYELVYIQKNNNKQEINQQIEIDTELMNNLIKVDGDITTSASQVVYPIIVRNLYFGVLIIEGPNVDDINKSSLLTTYIAIYCNQLNLLRTSNHDSLTGLFNRQTFDGTLNKLMSSKQSLHRRLSEDPSQPDTHYFAMLDIDNFKRLNDNFGHLMGDEVLLSMAQLMQKAFRDEDMLFRYGGEEFAIIVKHVDLKLAQIILERLRQLVNAQIFPQVGLVTVSIGFTIIDNNILPSTVIQRADQALYYAKENGRNQVHCYEDLIRDAKLTKPNNVENDIELF
ncbi:GGDEF domain-containing protein [Algibacillus agarilyticus]|uniref:GGDEF domain-containing protein n=1 Tax=Algibacillus agarilyticus TaxID=2234133 RepID=UPI000DCFB359|nr:GGDEF domain-containing protein [Algibacillus agarilyticus]